MTMTYFRRATPAARDVAASKGDARFSSDFILRLR